VHHVTPSPSKTFVNPPQGRPSVFPFAVVSRFSARAFSFVECEFSPSGFLLRVFYVDVPYISVSPHSVQEAHKQ
jgi:hypothetical protein